MSTLIGLTGILCVIIGCAVVVVTEDHAERRLAAIVLGLGMAGGFLMCLSNFVGG